MHTVVRLSAACLFPLTCLVAYAPNLAACSCMSKLERAVQHTQSHTHSSPHWCILGYGLILAAGRQAGRQAAETAVVVIGLL